jgi:general secretion pathway protein G
MKNKYSLQKTGFTLLEIMIVVAIIGLLVALLAKKFTGQQEIAEETATKAQLTNVTTDIETYRMFNFSYPSSLNDLVTRPSNARSWKQLRDKIPEDAWNEPLSYKCPGTHNPSKYDVYSKGPDKQDGTADDIGNWDK